MFAVSLSPLGRTFRGGRNQLIVLLSGSGRISIGARRLCATVGTIEEELKENGRGAQEVIRHHLALLALAVWRLVNNETRQPKPSPRAIVRGFGHLMELHILDHWTIGDGDRNHPRGTSFAA